MVRNIAPNILRGTKSGSVQRTKFASKFFTVKVPFMPRWFLILLLWPFVVPSFCSGQSTDPAAQSARHFVIGSTDAPRLGCWFLGRPELFTDEGAREFLAATAGSGSFNLFSASTRYDIEVTDDAFHDFMKRTTAEARDRFDAGILLDLDIRMARRAFEAKYPALYQQKLVFGETAFADGEASVVLAAETLTDHYTGGSVPYLVRGNKLVGAWTYEKNSDGEIIPETLVDVTSRVAVDSPHVNQLGVKLTDDGKFLAAACAFDYLYPDVFSPELISFEKEILHKYADVDLAGCCKDEWGFPPCFNAKNAHHEFWYSPNMAAAYAQAYSGRVLLTDLFEAWSPQCHREKERADAIDRYNKLCLDRHVNIETEYVKTTKEVFGENAFPATHPTWFPWPCANEFKKNGMSWWGVPRDRAQTDECAPYHCRNSLSKINGRAWYNMFYASEVGPYIDEHWGALLSGGRVNIHPLYPRAAEPPKAADSMMAILDGGCAEVRRLTRWLDFISDSPVAVVFGHYGAMNFARPEYDQVSTACVSLCDKIVEQGYPVDLTPSSESLSGRWSVRGEKAVYGAQAYDVVLFFGENDSDADDFAALEKNILAHAPKTRLFRVVAGWTNEELDAMASQTANALRKANIEPVTAWRTVRVWGQFAVDIPPRTGKARLLDGTRLWTASSENVSGDAIHLTDETAANQKISAEATGLFACRFDSEGKLASLAAGALTSFSGGGAAITFDKPTDLAIRRAKDGTWSGIVGSEGKPLDDQAVCELLGQ